MVLRKTYIKGDHIVPVRLGTTDKYTVIAIEKDIALLDTVAGVEADLEAVRAAETETDRLYPSAIQAKRSSSKEYLPTW
jgi:hypothetical protein